MAPWVRRTIFVYHAQRCAMLAMIWLQVKAMERVVKVSSVTVVT